MLDLVAEVAHGEARCVSVPTVIVACQSTCPVRGCGGGGGVATPGIALAGSDAAPLWAALTARTSKV